ncbi:MAG: lytic transglycosylase domain-containing protein [Clostridiales bacterium]
MANKGRSQGRWGKTVLLLVMIFVITIVASNKDILLRTLYPAPYYDEIAPLCQEFGEELALVLALIQTESRFRETALSSRGAVGLMQVMPDTAQWMADQLGLEDYKAENLHERQWNLKLGIAYLHYLRQQFPGSLVQALAAYNAGPTKVRSWLGEGQWDGSRENLEEIPYKETRNYVEKVMDRYEAYRRIY